MIDRRRAVRETQDIIQGMEYDAHNVEHIKPFVLDADGNEVADYTALIAITSHADANRMGAWVKIIDAAEISAMVSGHPATLFISSATANRFFNIQVGYGDGTLGGTEILANTQLNTHEKVGQEMPVDVIALLKIFDAVSHLYIRCSDSNGGSSFNLNIQGRPHPPVAVIHG